DFDRAALIQPLAIAHHGVTRRAGVKPGDLVLVVGAGPIGLFVQAVSRRAGARVVVTDRLPGRLELAGTIGADLIVDSRAGDVAQRVMDLTEGWGADHAFDCVGGESAAPLEACSASLRSGGSITVLGNYVTEVLPLPRRVFEAKELRVGAARRYSVGSYRESHQMMIDGSLELPDVVTHRFTLEETQEALERLASGDPEIVKAVIRPNADL